MGLRAYIQKNNKVIYRVMIGVACLLLIAATYQYYEIKDLMKSSVLGNYEVVKKYCGSYRTSSFIEVIYDLGIKKIEMGETRCELLKTGDTIELYFNSEKGMLFRTDQDEIYKRTIYLFGVIVLLALIPWTKMRDYVLR